MLLLSYLSFGYTVEEKLKELPKIYYINLDRSTSRNQYMTQLLDNLHLRYQRVLGIDALNDDPKKYYVGSWTFNTNPEKGCTLSHLKAIREYLEDLANYDDYAIIAEDDLSLDFVQYWNQTFVEYLNQAPSGWEILQLYSGTFEKPQFKFVKYSDSHFDTVAYLIKRSTANGF